MQLHEADRCAALIPLMEKQNLKPNEVSIAIAAAFSDEMQAICVSLILAYERSADFGMAPRRAEADRLRRERVAHFPLAAGMADSTIAANVQHHASYCGQSQLNACTVV